MIQRRSLLQEDVARCLHASGVMLQVFGCPSPIIMSDDSED